MSNFTSKSNIPASGIADDLRKKMGPVMGGDKFTTFTWRGQHSWTIHHCFIINNGSDLKWTNYGAVTNTYSNSMYETNKTLLGVSVKTKSVSLNLGLFAITEEEFRKFLYWMDPMAIDQLMFEYEPEYYYYAKLSSVGDATKYIVGKDEHGDSLYYAELNVKFDLQGDGYAYSRNPIQWTLVDNVFKVTGENAAKISDIRVPFILEWTNNVWNPPTTLVATIYRKYTDDNDQILTESKELFNLRFSDSVSLSTWEGIRYESGSGTLLSANGQLLSYLSRGDNGEKVFNSFSVNKFLLPSNFNDGIESLNDIYIELRINNSPPSSPDAENIKIYHYNKTLVL